MPFIFQRETSAGHQRNFWLSCALIDASAKAVLSKEEVIERLAANGIEGRYLWTPLPYLDMYKYCLFYDNGIGRLLYDRSLCLPSGSNLSLIDKERIVRVIEQLF